MIGVAKPLLLDFPDSFETERLINRVPRAGDGPAIQEALNESIENLKLFLPQPWAQAQQPVEEAEEGARRSAARWILREDLRLLLFRKSDGYLVGGSGLHRIDWNVMRFEIGYWVRSSLEGHGYISEAVAGLTAFAFDVIGAQRIEIRCDSLNERSSAVARRAGYVLEGTLRNNYDTADKSSLRDTQVFSMLRAEYLSRKAVTDTEKK